MTMKYDTVEYNELCLSSEWILDVLKFIITLNLDINECAYGILAMFLPGDFENCEWKNYYVDYPIYEIGLDDANLGVPSQWQGTFV